MISVLFLVVMFICVAMMWTEGAWSNAVTFVNTVFAAILASVCFEPLADYLDKQLPTFTYVWDFLTLMLLFAGLYSVLRLITDSISKHRVRFKMPLEQGGRAIFAVATAWVLVCFLATALHTAPLARTSFRGSFGKEPMSNHFFGLAPDRLWLGFLHSRSAEKKALSHGQPRQFDPQAEFILKYGSRRQALQEHNALEGSIRVNK